MANGRSPGRRSGTGGFSGSGRSRGGKANRGGGDGKNHSKGSINSGALGSALGALGAALGAAFGGNTGGNTGGLSDRFHYVGPSVGRAGPAGYADMGSLGSRYSDRGISLGNNRYAFAGNPALSMQYTPRTGEWSIVNNVTGRTLGKMERQWDGSYEATGVFEQMAKGSPATFGVGETFNSYAINDKGQLDYSKVIEKFTTRKSTEPGYAYTTITETKEWYGTKIEKAHYNPSIGSVNRVDTTRDTFIGKFTYDWHTMNTRKGPVEVGFATEMAIDAFEAFNADYKTINTVAKVASFISTVASIALSALNLVSVAPFALRNLQAFSVALSSLNNIAEGLGTLADMFGGNLSIDRTERSLTGGSSLTSHMFNGSSELIGVTRENLPGLYLTSPLHGEYNFANTAEALMPVKDYSIFSRNEFLKPNIQPMKGTTMAQVDMPVTLTGMNNVREGHLLSVDEAQYLRNVSTITGTIKSSNKHGTPENLGNNYDAVYLYDDDGYVGGIKYQLKDGVSFASVANQTFALVSGKLYRVNTKKAGINAIENAIELPTISTGNISIRIKNGIANSLLEQIQTMIQNIKVVAPVEKVNEKEPKDGTIPKYVNIAATITTENYSDGIKEHLKDGKRFFHLKGTTAANNGDRIAIILGGSITYGVAADKLWEIDVDLLDAFGSILNVNNNGTDEIYYAVTAYDKATGMESLPVKSNSCFNFSKLIHLYVENPNEKYSLKIYRKDISSSMYKFISLQSYKGNNVFIDNLADIPSPQFLDFTEIKEVTGLKGLVEHKATLFAYKGSYVYFSKPGRPNIWNELQCVTVNEQITGLASSPLGLMIFTKYSTYLLGGTDSVSYTISNLSKSIGCSDTNSIANIKNAVVWISDGDVMLSIGSTINNLTKGRYSFVNPGETLKIINAIVVGDIYYVFTDTKVVKMDFGLNHPVITEMDITNSFGAIRDNQLYFVNNSQLYKAYDSLEYSTMVVKTVKFIGTSMDILKEFNYVNIVLKGNLNVKVFIDDTLVTEQSYNVQKPTVANIGIPVDFNEGLYIHLEISGEGQIYSYRYIFDNRNLR